MKKQIIKMSMLAMMVMGGVNAAHADTKGTVQVTGVVNTLTCQVSLSRPTIDLGGMIPSALNAANTLFNAQDVTVSLSGCGNAAAQAGAGIQLDANPITGSSNKIFGSDTSATWGFGVAKKDAPATLLAKGEFLFSAVAGDLGTALEAKTYPATIGFAAPTASPTASAAQTTGISFSFVNP
ncbi:type 1 fimbrial protein [Enterobacter sp. CGMCC 5087]|uniref:type 1 fimbrial protein n=1 Tax=Enterobacter sp. CGMCC 5087 TaxID=2183878 RepID=UPI0015E82B3F|nr:type 1 fimbrial protein [Enterobacter sp. CGMCC 5087]